MTEDTNTGAPHGAPVGPAGLELVAGNAAGGGGRPAPEPEPARVAAGDGRLDDDRLRRLLRAALTPEQLALLSDVFRDADAYRWGEWSEADAEGPDADPDARDDLAAARAYDALRAALGID